LSTIGILSDVHGNRPALCAVLERAGQLDSWWCAGDTVGYGPFPNECCSELGEQGSTCVAGNHDLGSTGQIGLEAFNGMAREACMWTRGKLEAANRDWLDSLPLTAEPAPGVLLVHGSFADPIWEYVLSKWRALENFRLYQQELCFHGHSHVPAVFSCDHGGNVEFLAPYDGMELTLEPGMRYMVNVGSVGQPRDGDPRACYVSYHPEERRLTYHRVQYPVGETQSRMELEGLPAFLAERLGYGR
jgi:diadenosine tetraphosphatase ApaH/serine/threonine PP2A family protein phosphatase